MDLRSRPNDSDLRQRPRTFTLRRGRLVVWSVGIMVAVAACGQGAGQLATNHSLDAAGSVRNAAGMHAPGSNVLSPGSGSRSGSARPAGGPSPPLPGESPSPGSSPTASAEPSGTANPTAGPTPTAAPTPTPSPKPTPAPGTRNKLLWPFASTSIWNMPIGRGAVYVPAHIAPPTIQSLTTDQDIIVMDPTAPLVTLIHSGAGWGGANRCVGTGPTLASVPIPSNFIVSSNGHNDALAVLMPDGQTVLQGQPFARCAAGAVGTVLALAPSDNLYGAGILGAHGGSGLSALGGTIRLNELVPGAEIRHALKVNVDGLTDLYPSPGYRWPAVRHDGCAPGCYGGSVPAMEMGSLLAIPASVNINALGLETTPGRMLAWTLQNYGAYVADDSARSVFSIETEYSPSGSVATQFQQTWGFPFQAPAGSGTPWSHDINVILANLNVVANNGPASIGGGGTPLQPLAPPIGN
ncbi:MAG: hypothetical protein WCB51_09060 [Candidatus Dormiibacterota bacterium]